jgi:hypothetical protein
MDKKLMRCIKDLKKLCRHGGEEDFVDDLLCRLIRNKSQLFQSVAPKSGSKSRYVGVEIECFSECSQTDLAVDFYEAGLDGKVTIGSDSSVEPDQGEDYEIRVMDTEQNIAKTLKKVFAIL